MSIRTFTNIFLLVLIRILLDLAYVYYVVPSYSYAGFNLVLDIGQYVVSWVLYIAVFLLTPSTLRKVSDTVFMMVTTSIIAPLTSMYGLSGESIVPVVMAILSMGIVYAIVNMKLLPAIHLPYFNNGERLSVILSLAFVLVVVVHYLLSGVHLNLNFSNVYDFRDTNAALAGTGIFAYLNPWVYQVFNLLLIAICLMKKRYLMAVVFFIVQVFLFTASQHKSVFFTPFIIIGVWWYLRKSNNLLVIPAALITIIAVSLLFYTAYGNAMLPSLGIRRIFFVPAHMSFVYYAFFSSHPAVYWGDSSVMPFIQSPYAVTVPYVIGNYLGTPNMSANNGYVSSGFAQAGVVGIFIYTVILGYVLRFVDSASRSLDAVWFGVALFLLPIMVIWRSSDLVTSMWTHGVLLMLILLGLLRRPSRSVVVMGYDPVSIRDTESRD